MVQVSCFPILLQPSHSTCTRGIWRVSLQGRRVCAARVERREQHLVARQVSVGTDARKSVAEMIGCSPGRSSDEDRKLLGWQEKHCSPHCPRPYQRVIIPYR